MAGNPIGVTRLEVCDFGACPLYLQTAIGAGLAEACCDRTRAADRIQQKRIFPPGEEKLDLPIRQHMASRRPPEIRAVLDVPRSDHDANPAFDESSMILTELKQLVLRISVERQ